MTLPGPGMSSLPQYEEVMERRWDVPPGLELESLGMSGSMPDLESGMTGLFDIMPPEPPLAWAEAQLVMDGGGDPSSSGVPTSSGFYASLGGLIGLAGAPEAAPGVRLQEGEVERALAGFQRQHRLSPLPFYSGLGGAAGPAGPGPPSTTPTSLWVEGLLTPVSAAMAAAALQAQPPEHAVGASRAPGRAAERSSSQSSFDQRSLDGGAAPGACPPSALPPAVSAAAPELLAAQQRAGGGTGYSLRSGGGRGRGPPGPPPPLRPRSASLPAVLGGDAQAPEQMRAALASSQLQGQHAAVLAAAAAAAAAVAGGGAGGAAAAGVPSLGLPVFGGADPACVFAQLASSAGTAHAAGLAATAAAGGGSASPVPPAAGVPAMLRAASMPPPGAAAEMQCRLAAMQAQLPKSAQAALCRRRCLERYREKKSKRTFRKAIRYQMRKINADKRPRFKGRFIKTGDPLPPEMVEAAAAAATAAARPAAPLAAAPCASQPGSLSGDALMDLDGGVGCAEDMQRLLDGFGSDGMSDDSGSE